MIIQSKWTRESLLHALKEQEQKQERFESVERQFKEDGDRPARESLWADQWLVEQSIRLIKEAIINNELKDF